MPKNFLVVLAFFQAFLTFLHWLVYQLLLFFFPQLLTHHTGLLAALVVVSFSFFSFSAISYNHDNPFLRWGYVLSAILLVLGLYLLSFSALALLASLFLPGYQTLLCVTAAGLSLALTAYGLINARVLRVVEIRPQFNNLPSFWQNKVAVMVSDWHLGQILRLGTAQKIVNKINELKADIVFIPGDFYDGVHADFPALAAALKNVRAQLGVYFSSGNHEAYAGYEKCEQALSAAGVKILEDEKVEIEGLQIAGLAYANETDEQVTERLNKMQIDQAKPSILLKHVPNHLDPVAKAGVSLQLSGHTHLGQVWPFKWITSKVFRGFDYGFKKLGDLQLYTSSGSGTWGPPIRTFTPSEIIKILF